MLTEPVQRPGTLDLFGNSHLGLEVALPRGRILHGRMILRHRHMDLTHQSHRQRQALHVQYFLLSVNDLQADGVPEDIQQIPADFGSVIQPIIMKQKVVAIVIAPHIHIKVGEQFQNGGFGFFGVYTFLVVDLSQFGTIHECPVFQIFQLLGNLRYEGWMFRHRQFIGLTGIQVHEFGKVNSG